MNRETAGDISAVTVPLLAWYAQNRRSLPWRENPTPYRVWVSEIMLQQTRIETVRGYFDRFMKAFPTLPSLAEAPEDAVLKLWEGLGYYSRARNLQKAARICMEMYGGELPSSKEALLKLPGIGPYTAGAVASIAWGKRAAAVDGNVIRVLTRLLADGSDISGTAFRRRMEETVLAAMPEEDPGLFNEALMELGERICLPGSAADCGNCPAAASCKAHAAGKEEAFPVRPGKKARKVERKTVLVISCGHRFAIRKRPGKGLLAGTYEFPWLPGHRSRREAADFMSRHCQKFEVSELPEARHVFTHLEWEMTGYRITLPEECSGDWYFEEAEVILRECSLPSAWRTYASELWKH